ncbi:hypothetical protein N9W89_08720 [Hellea sp.]|nr:hypothetical protein [Hellea sp.]
MSRSFSILKPLDEDKIAAILKIDLTAAEDGKNDLPGSQATELSGFERKILNEVQTYHTKVRADVQRDRALREKELAEHSTRLMDAGVVPRARARLQHLQLEIDNRKRELARARKELDGSELMLERFSKPRNIVDAPSMTKNSFLNFAILTVVVFLEALANMAFFSEGNELGLLGGVIIAAGISTMNVFGFFALGYFGVRYKNCNVIWQKISGYFVLAISLLSLLIFHSVVAFYRQIKAENPDIELAIASDKAISRLFQFDFLGLDIVSVLLLILGIAFGLIALGKGVTFGHPIPGFERRYKKVKAAEGHLGYVKDEFKLDFVDGTEDIIDTLKSSISAQGDHVRRYQQLYDDITNFERRYDQFELDLLSAARHLIDRYRLTNSKVRTSPKPSYFETPFDEKSKFQTPPHNTMTPPAEILSKAEKRSLSAQALLDDIEQDHKELRAILLEDVNGAA